MNHSSSLFPGLILILCFFILSCDSPPSQQSEVATDGRPVVGVITCRTTPYWTAVEYGANHSADKNDLRLLWQELTQQDSIDLQTSAINNLIASRVQGIIIASQHELMLSDAVKKANDLGIYVLLLDSQPPSNKQYHAEWKSSVATDQYHAGQLAADEIARLLNEKGRVAVIRYSPMVTKTDNREEGFLDQIRSYPEIRLVGQDMYVGTESRRAKEKLTNFLKLYSRNSRSELDGVFISDEDTACEMLRAIEQAEFDNKIIFAAFGSDSRLVTGMLTYSVDALFVEQPAIMGQQAVDAMAELLRGQSVASFVDSGVHCITIDNLSTPYSQALLNTPSEQSLEILLNDMPESQNRSKAGENAESQVPSEE